MNWKPTFENILRHLSKLGFTKGKLLDVGCGFGHFLNLAKQRGFDVIGIEPSSEARRLSHEKFGLSAFVDIAHLSEDTGPFDVIVCAETLYYVVDVSAFLKQLIDRLKPEGFLVLEVKCNRAYLFRIAALLQRLRGGQRNVGPNSLLRGASLTGYHLFTTFTLRRLLTTVGFEVLHIVNERHTVLYSFGLHGVAKLLYTSVAGLVRVATFGNLKIGTEITIYSQLKIASLCTNPKDIRQ